MNFENVNRLNVLVNAISGNWLPLTSLQKKIPLPWRFYIVVGWLITFAHIISTYIGALKSSKARAFKDSSVNLVVSTECIVLIRHMHNFENLIREIIDHVNRLLREANPSLRDVVKETTQSLEKVSKIYTITSLFAIIVWSGIPLLRIFRNDQFNTQDYRMPATWWREPYSPMLFIFGGILQIIGSSYTFLKKTGVDIYTIHLLLLTTSMYRYLRFESARILRNETIDETLVMGRDGSQDLSVAKRMKVLLRHYGIVVQIAGALKKLLSLNVGISYLSSVYRICFVCLMAITSRSQYFDECLVFMYSSGVLTQVYMLCYCMQQLNEASTELTDDAFHEKWYVYGPSLRNNFGMMILANKLECRLSSLRSIDLTLSSFMSILNQAYSVCLIFLRTQ